LLFVAIFKSDSSAFSPETFSPKVASFNAKPLFSWNENRFSASLASFSCKERLRSNRDKFWISTALGLKYPTCGLSSPDWYRIWLLSREISLTSTVQSGHVNPDWLRLSGSTSATCSSSGAAILKTTSESSEERRV